MRGRQARSVNGRMGLIVKSSMESEANAEFVPTGQNGLREMMGCWEEHGTIVE